jgi:hypothetical protein
VFLLEFRIIKHNICAAMHAMLTFRFLLPPFFSNTQQLMSVYSKIVEHPVDLGKVCRGIRRRQYKSLRAVRLDAWRIFANCVKYHCHPSNKNSIPSFVSIALHLRDYFNALWQEHMLPSDPPSAAAAGGGEGGKQKGNVNNEANNTIILRKAMEKRKAERKKRVTVSGLTVMTGKCIERTAISLRQFIENGGCVDKLDTKPIFGGGGEEDDDEEGDLNVVLDNLKRLLKRLDALIASNDEYGLDEFDREVRACYTEEVLENNPALRNRISHRLDRFLGKIVVPIHEANCRGVTQSSIWGCMAAAVWARESSKKPFWPALVLGIMAPEDQKEEWHIALTERNEARLPEKLRTQLSTGKRKAEQAIKRQGLGQLEPQSFFLVEFLGTHEFIWVKESDIVENFDPSDDPNQLNTAVGSKKKRSSRSDSASVFGSKKYASAVEEGRWALDEFELQLQDTCGDIAEDEEDGEDMNYSYSVLCQSDDEADEEETLNEEYDVSMLDVEECNELLATEGLLDFTAMGRKNAKRRAQMMKKQKIDAEKKQKADKLKKVKADSTKKKKEVKSKDLDVKKETRDLEKRRKKRGRDREKALKGSAQKTKKRKTSTEELKKAPSGRRNVIAGKRERATAIVEGYLSRVARQQDYKSLGLGGVMTIPASMVDSSGLLGMALAFRAAAGEITMPDDNGAQDARLKPWEGIDVDGKTTADERNESLQQQIALLEKEVERVRSSTKRRRELCEEAKRSIDEIEANVAEEDQIARQNPFKKNKKAPTPDKKAKVTDKGGKAVPNGKKATGEHREIDNKPPETETAVEPSQETDHQAEPIVSKASEKANGKHADHSVAHPSEQEAVPVAVAAPVVEAA